MLRRLRTSSPARAVLCLAVLLATAAAFGLHPEPLDDGHGASPEISRTESARSGAHFCVACLTHLSSLTAPPAAVLLVPSAAAAAAPPLTVPAPPRLSRTPCSGLSPPALS